MITATVVKEMVTRYMNLYNIEVLVIVTGTDAHLGEQSMTREEWLLAATDLLREDFEAVDVLIPEKVRAACGWPSEKKWVGECWQSAHSAGGFVEIFISPMVYDSLIVLEVLTHELIHATGIRGHKEPFCVIAGDIGFKGDFAIPDADMFLCERFWTIIEQLGEYPHSKLTPLL